MTDDDKTVPVRVKDLKEWVNWLGVTNNVDWPLRKKIEAYIPKPHLVQVDLDELKAIANFGTQNALWRMENLKALIERLEGEQA